MEQNSAFIINFSPTSLQLGEFLDYNSDYGNSFSSKYLQGSPLQPREMPFEKKKKVRLSLQTCWVALLYTVFYLPHWAEQEIGGY